MAAVRPNIVVIMADDLDAKSLARLIASGLMPHLKNVVVDRGVTFTSAYVANALCCPSRATYLTGLYVHNHRVLSNHPPEGAVIAFDDRHTLPTWLQRGGYRTSYIGKYLNAYGKSDVNRDRAIDEKDRTYVPPGWDDWQVLLDPTTYRMYSYIINDNGVLATHGSADQDYQTDVLARRAAAFIRETTARNPAVPFFLTVMPLAPHVEVGPNVEFHEWNDIFTASLRPAPRHAGTVPAPLPQPSSFNEADVSGKPDWVQQHPPLTEDDISALQSKYQDRLAAMRAVDDMIGTIAAALQQTGRLAETVIIFTSDNGFLLGEHRLTEKRAAYEESVRVPLIIRIPGGPQDQTRSQTALNTDLAPTIAELAGIMPERSVDGTSLMPVIRNASRAGRKRFLVEHWHVGRPRPVDFDVPDYDALRVTSTGASMNHLYVEYRDASQAGEFYDLATDPHQLRNLFFDTSPHRTSQRNMHAQWLAALKSCGNGSCQSLEFR